MPEKITNQRTVDRLLREAKAGSPIGRDDHPVEGSPGLYLRTGRRERRWVLRYRVHQEKGQRRADLGNADSVKLADAKDVAATWRESAKKGFDPRGATAPAVMKAAPTVDELATRWLEVRGSDPDPRERLSPRSVTSYRNHLARFRKVYGNRRAHLLTAEEVKALLDEYRTAGKLGMANGMRRAVSSMYAWAIEEKLLPAGTTNPARDLPRRYKRANEREHKLSVREIAELYVAASRVTWPYGLVIQMLALTGKRRSIVERMRWDWRVDGVPADAPIPHLRIPADAEGSKGQPGVLVETAAVATLLETASFTSEGLDHVFARMDDKAAAKVDFDNQKGKGDPERVSSLNQAWLQVKRIARQRFGDNPNRDGARLNDFRRAIQSAAADSGSFELRELADLFIGHKASAGVQSVYERSGFERAHARFADWWEGQLLDDVARIDPQSVPASVRDQYPRDADEPANVVRLGEDRVAKRLAKLKR